MKLLFDFLPIFLFFIAYKLQGIYFATGIAMSVSLLQVLGFWLIYRRVEMLQIITLILITVLGSATLLLHNDLFIKWKPTAINWAFAAIFLASQFIGQKNIAQRMLEANVVLPKIIWLRLNMSWVIFFILTGFANLYVIYHFDQNTWVNFKLFGMMGMTIFFVILQAIYIAKHIAPDQNTHS